MPAYAAFLRAVNVSGTGKLAMEDLRRLIQEIGGRRAATYIASGNAVFEHDDDTPGAVKAALEARLEAFTRRAAGVMIRTTDDLDTVLSELPWPEADPKQLMVLFLDGPVPEDPEANQITDESIAPGPGCLYVHYPSGMGRSKLAYPAQKTGTARNLNTVRKVHGMLRALGSP
ncbi:DUF1697 domain-containing protein [Allosediminivita pacifica]|uniref:DUF1697 domain-containing protein n=1 Tax=Allosediminivita pacifica TaxID=1267769 RepID=UPI000D36292F|nr:DUF1697 domain-containing protein [Allosediminivita pacifica]GGB04501.1 hypothetical protein GCM10011324_13370 [Allosediminivita pacifica]